MPDCAKWKNEYWKHFRTAATWKVRSGQGQGTYGSHGSHGSLQLCVSGTCIWNLRLEVLHCSVHGEFLASLETEHNSPNPVASNKTQEASGEAKVYLDLGFSLSCLDLYHGWWLLYDSWSCLVMLLEDLREIPWMLSVEIHFTALGQHLMVFRSKILKGHMFSKILWPPIVLSSRPRDVGVGKFESEMCWEPKWLLSLNLNQKKHHSHSKQKNQEK